MLNVERVLKSERDFRMLSARGRKGSILVVGYQNTHFYSKGGSLVRVPSSDKIYASFNPTTSELSFAVLPEPQNEHAILFKLLSSCNVAVEEDEATSKFLPRASNNSDLLYLSSDDPDSFKFTEHTLRVSVLAVLL